MAWLYPGTEDPWAAAFDPSYWVPSAQVMHKPMGTDMQVKGIPNGKHQRDLQGPPQLCVCPPNAWNPVAISCTRPGKPVTQTKSVSALHFSVASASPSGFCKVFPVDLADSLCWHVAKSAQNITICWPQPGLSFVFVWP